MLFFRESLIWLYLKFSMNSSRTYVGELAPIWIVTVLDLDPLNLKKLMWYNKKEIKIKGVDSIHLTLVWICIISTIFLFLFLSYLIRESILNNGTRNHQLMSIFVTTNMHEKLHIKYNQNYTDSKNLAIHSFYLSFSCTKVKQILLSDKKK